jgi:hypothetical protein
VLLIVEMNRRLSLLTGISLGAFVAFVGGGCNTSATTPPADAGEDSARGVDASSPPDADTDASSPPDADADATPPSDADTDASDAGASDADTDAACTGADLAARWLAMDDAPVTPPNLYAHLDLAGPSGTGLTLAEAQAVNCAGTIVVADDAGDWPAVVWGAGGVDVSLGYDKTSLKGSYIILDKAPPFTFKSRDGAHTYAIAIGQAVTKDGAAFAIDWTSETSADPALTELDDAVRATFAPQLPVDSDCLGLAPTQNCGVEPDDNAGHSIVGFYGPDAAGSRRLAFNVAFTKGTNVTQFFLAWPVLPEVDGGVDAGDGG